MICSESRDYETDDSFDSRVREKRAKKESDDLIKKQFALRRNPQVCVFFYINSN